MKSIIDQRRINQRKFYSNLASTGGLLVLLFSVVLPTFLQVSGIYISILMVSGLAISMIGIYYANRWVKKPRPEESLDRALKGLSDSHFLFHYPSLPYDHILLSPSGIVILETINLEGEFSYINGKWKENFNFSRAIRYIVEEHLGDPFKSASSAVAHFRQVLHANIPESEIIPIKPIVVFCNPGVMLKMDNPPLKVCLVSKLRKYVADNQPKLPPELWEQLFTFLNNKTIVSRTG